MSDIYNNLFAKKNALIKNNMQNKNLDTYNSQITSFSISDEFLKKYFNENLKEYFKERFCELSVTGLNFNELLNRHISNFLADNIQCDFPYSIKISCISYQDLKDMLNNYISQDFWDKDLHIVLNHIINDKALYNALFFILKSDIFIEKKFTKKSKDIFGSSILSIKKVPENYLSSDNVLMSCDIASELFVDFLIKMKLTKVINSDCFKDMKKYYVKYSQDMENFI